MGSLGVTWGHWGLHEVTEGYRGLIWVTGDYYGLHGITVVTEGYRGLFWVTVDYRGLLGIMWGNWGLHEVTGGYK